MPPPDNDTPATTIKEANIANILAKLKAGGILSDREEKRLTAYQAKQQADAEERDGRTADSMKAAAAMAGIPLETVEKAKAAGCPAFRGSRVHVDQLTEWLEENADTLPTGNSELDAIQVEIAREKLRKAQFERDQREGKFIERATVAARVGELAEALKQTLRLILEDQAPRRQEGKSAEELRAINREFVDEICDTMQTRSQWTKSDELG